MGIRLPRNYQVGARSVVECLISPDFFHGFLDRLVFHDKLDSLLTRVRNAVLTNSAAKKNPEVAKLKIPEGLACRAPRPGTKMVVYDQDRCDLCYQVFEQLAEICALYLGISPDAAVICMAILFAVCGAVVLLSGRDPCHHGLHAIAVAGILSLLAAVPESPAKAKREPYHITQ
jgi:hypothetical protein